MTTHEVLVAARNLLELDGWANCPMSGGPRCAGNAISDIAYEIDGSCYHEAHDVLAGLLGGEFPYALYRWNDASGRTKEEVLALFDKAIAQTAPAPDFASLEAPVEVLA